MLLMDTIADGAALIAGSGHRDPLMQCYANVVAKLDGVPRFLLDAKATRTAVELNLGRPKVIVEAMRSLRIPYTRMWCEWDDADRQKLRERFDEPLTFAELRPMPGRVGFLIEADAGGRRGTVTWAWTTPRPDLPEGERFPNIGAIETSFDLDRIMPMEPERREGLLRGNLARQWLDNPVQLAALFDIWSHARFAPSAWGECYLDAFGRGSLAETLAYSDVVGEWIMVIAVVLMLTASRPVIEMVPVDQGKINKHRRRKGEVPLYDYTRVTLHLSHQPARGAARGPLGHARKSPRVHLVSSYLARRGEKHWVVSPYWRGEGETVSRHVNVKG